MHRPSVPKRPLGARLNTIHNLYYYQQLMRGLRHAIAEGRLQICDTEYAARHFGNFFVEFDGPFVRLKVVRDRMQFLVDFAGPASDSWIDDDTIWHLIRADDVSVGRERQDLRSLEQVALATAEHFSSIRDLFAPENGPETLHRANEYREARAKKHFGYSSSGSADDV